MASRSPSTDAATAGPDAADDRTASVRPRLARGEGIVDLERLLADGAITATVVETLRATLVATIGRSAESLLVEPDGADWRLRYRHDDGLSELRLDRSAALPAALATLSRLLAGEARGEDGDVLPSVRVPLHTAFALRLNDTPWWVELRALPEGPAASYELTLHPRPLAPPTLDALGLDPDQLLRLRERLRRRAGWLPLGVADAAGGARLVRAVAQEIVAPERRVVVLEPPLHPPLARVTQLDAGAAAELVSLEADAVLLAATAPDAVLSALAARAAEGAFVVQRTAARHPSIVLARLLALGLSPAWIARSVPLVVMRHRLRRVCPACRIAAPSDCRDAHWLDTVHAPPVRDVSAWLARSIETRRYHRGVGCAHCHESGHDGVLDVFDLVALDRATRAALERDDVETALARVDAAGDLSRRLRALVAGGEITAAEAGRHLRATRY